MDSERSFSRTLLLTMLAMLAFAGNSVIGRLALRDGALDATSFTVLRLLAGAVVLTALVGLRSSGRGGRAFAWIRQGGWMPALALFIYAITFSFAYRNLTAATGALLLFGAVQVSMILIGLRRGERLRPVAVAGFLLAVAGLIALLLPGLAAPPVVPAALMLISGTAWGVYSILGRGVADPLVATAANFLRAFPLSVLILMVVLVAPADFSGDTRFLRISDLNWNSFATVYAILSGGLTSGLGYAIWYAALPGLKSAQAASVQLSVPVITALAGVVLLGEAISLRLLICSVVILGGIGLIISDR